MRRNHHPAVNFWAALWNSIYSSVLIAVAVVISSTLAGWAFAKLKFAELLPPHLALGTLSARSTDRRGAALVAGRPVAGG